MANNRKEEEENTGDEMEASSPENPASGSDLESGSETEPEQPPKKAPVAAPKKPPPQDSSSSSEESDSDSGSDRVTKNLVVKPISSKPMDDPPQKPAPVKKPKSKPNAAAKPTSSAAAAGAKRQADDGEAKESKRSKKKPDPVENPMKEKPSEDVKRQLFQRLWSEEDEIAVLKGMIDYGSKKKSDPVADLNAFHEFIKKSVHVDVSKTQLQDKIRRLKKKYENNAGKEKKGKKERTFSKPHEQKAYDLSKTIWGKEKNENGTIEKEESKSGGKDNGVFDEVTTTTAAATTTATYPVRSDKWGQVEEEEKSVEGSEKRLNLVSCGKSVAAIEGWLKENSGLISVEKRIEMKKKMKDLEIAQIDLHAKRIGLIVEQYSLVREAMKTSRK